MFEKNERKPTKTHKNCKHTQKNAKKNKGKQNKTQQNKTKPEGGGTGVFVVVVVEILTLIALSGISVTMASKLL